MGPRRKIRKGMSQRQASEELEKDQERELKEVIYPAESLRRRFRRQKPKVGTNVPTPEVKEKPPKPYTNAVYFADKVISWSASLVTLPDGLKNKGTSRPFTPIFPDWVGNRVGN